jgi:hypothetical protein
LARRKEAAALISSSATPSVRHLPADSSSRVIAMRAVRRQLEHRSQLSGDSPRARSAPALMEGLLYHLLAAVVRHYNFLTVEVFE